MNYNQYLDKMKKIQNLIIIFLDNDEDTEENFQNLVNVIDPTISTDIHEQRIIFHLLVKISNDHHRISNFFQKIERILLIFTNAFKKFTISEIFEIFKGNKRILLFLIEEGIVNIDKYVFQTLTNNKYKSV